MPKNALIACLLFAGAVQASPQSTTGGFYVICNPSQGGAAQTYCQTAAALQYVDFARTVPNNLLLAIAWRDFETSDGVYVWNAAIGGGNESIDTYLTNAVALGMNISIALIAGIQTPSWVFDAVPYVTFTPLNPGNLNCFSGTGSQTGTVLTITAVTTGTIAAGNFVADSNQSAIPGDEYIVSLGTGTGTTGTYNMSRSATTGAVTVQNALVSPTAWNATYLSKFNAAITQIASHLASVNGADIRPYVKIVKLSGINNTTEEFRNLAGTGGGTCNSINANQAWATAGWTPANITTAFNSILTNTITAFGSSPFPTDLVYSTDVIQVNGMPAVDDTGAIYTPPPSRSDEVTRTVMSQMLGNASYSSRKFAVQWNALSNQIPAPQPAMSYYQSLTTGYNNDVFAWQLNERGGTNGGSDCYYGSIPITFTTGLSAGALSGTLVDNNHQINGNNTVTFSDATTKSSVFSSTSTSVQWASGLSGNVTATATVTGFCNCSYAQNTGTEAGDYEQVLQTGLLIGSKFIEYYGVDLADLQTAIASIQTKAMRLPQ